MTVQILGWNEDGERYTVEISLQPITGTHAGFDHTPVEGGQRLSVCGAIYKGRTDIAFGQIATSLPEIVKFASGWNAERVEELRVLWERWHLNDVKAGCIHQGTLVWEDSTYGKRIDLDGTTNHPDNVCPVGYKYGSAWLTEPLTDEAIAAAKGFGA